MQTLPGKHTNTHDLILTLAGTHDKMPDYLRVSAIGLSDFRKIYLLGSFFRSSALTDLFHNELRRCRTVLMDVLSINNSSQEVARRTTAIRDGLLEQSRCLRLPNFEKINVDDLKLVFRLYDRNFFDGWLEQAVKAKTSKPMSMRLSSTMTRAGGKTFKYRRRTILGDVCSYEIAVASRMLFMTFNETDRDVTIGGLVCRDRLDALQRIIEHEIIHLVELLCWDESSCSAKRFKILAARIFGHCGTTHDLVTPREHAAKQHGIKVGGMVRFYSEGRPLAGRVNGIHRRATVLVEDAAGMPYSDGNKYQKFYIPLKMLRPLTMNNEQ
jgi:hypothetical protein